MEVGPVATDFEQEDISVTQNKCFRYFRKFGSDGDQNYIPVSEMGGTQDNYRTRANYLLSPVMRAIPSLSFSTLQVNVLRSSGGSNAVTSVALASAEAGAAGLSAFFHTAQISGQEAGQIAFARVSNSDSGYLFFDAEL